MNNLKNALFGYAHELEYKLVNEEKSLFVAVKMEHQLDALITLMKDAFIYEEYMETPIEGGHYYG